jgi:hypothetical protein
LHGADEERAAGDHVISAHEAGLIAGEQAGPHLLGTTAQGIDHPHGGERAGRVPGHVRR